MTGIIGNYGIQMTVYDKEVKTTKLWLCCRYHIEHFDDNT